MPKTTNLNVSLQAHSADHLFLPNFCSVRTIFVTVLFTQILAFILTFSPLSRPHYGLVYLQSQLLTDLALTSLFMHWVSLVSISILCLLRRWLTLLNSNLLAALLSYLLILSLAGLASEVAWTLQEYITGQVSEFTIQHQWLMLRNFCLSLFFCSVLFVFFWKLKLWQVPLLLVGYFTILALTLLLTELANLFSLKESVLWEHALQHQLFLIRNLSISAMVAAIALRYFYMRNEWKQKTVAHATARLQALQARIRPHFLFNSMNTIASLIRFDPVRAEQAVEDLSELFRASLSKEGNYIILEREIALCEQYLRVEALRLDERLNINWQIDNVPQDALIPPLCLQPLLENAIYYGIQPLPEGGTIHVTGLFDGRYIRLEIENPLPDYATINHKGNRMAQENIHQRLQACFGNAAGLTITTDQKTYRVSVRFPYHTEINL